MKRKLFSALLCVFALLLLMGASDLPAQSIALSLEEETLVPAEEEAIQIETETPEQQSAEAEEPTEETAEEAMVEDAVESAEVEVVDANVDTSLLVNGKPVSTDTDKMILDGTTYVALTPMIREMLPQASVTWDNAAGTTTVRTEQLTLSAKQGESYIVANGRYLYIPQGLQIRDGRMVLPLRTLVKALDAQTSWSPETGVISVTTGSGAILPGSQFYDENTLFWLSRLITAESGNQSLKGMMAVGNVLLNRVKSPAFPNTIEGVLAQKNQFTTYKNGKLANRTPFERCVIAAKLVMDGGEVEEIQGALYFDSAANSWASRHKVYVATLGGHRFFK